MNKTNFVTCEKCGKKLIERKSNGLWVFKFGKNGDEPLVHLEIYGSIKMTCLRRSCRHVNILHFFPPYDTVQVKEVKEEQTNKQ